MADDNLTKLEKEQLKAAQAADRLRDALTDLTRGSAEYEAALTSQMVQQSNALQATLALARARNADAEEINNLRSQLNGVNQRLKDHKANHEAAAAAQEQYNK